MGRRREGKGGRGEGEGVDWGMGGRQGGREGEDGGYGGSRSRGWYHSQTDWARPGLCYEEGLVGGQRFCLRVDWVDWLIGGQGLVREG